MSIVEIANKEAVKNHIVEFEEIELQIGSLSGIELDALKFSWNVGIKNSTLEGAELKIDFIQAKGKCMDCEEVFDIENFFSECPNCKSYLVEVLQGKELKIKHLVAKA